MMNYQANAARMFWYSVTPTLVGVVAGAVFVAIVARRQGLNVARWTPTGLFLGPAITILGMILLGKPSENGVEKS